MNIQEAIEQGKKILIENNIKSAKLDSEILMSKVLQKDRKYIILNFDKELKRQNFLLFKELVFKRSLGKPVAYLTGKKDFWNYNFVISEQTLIPRPDTEILIENILKITKHKTKLNILDLKVLNIIRLL